MPERQITHQLPHLQLVEGRWEAFMAYEPRYQAPRERSLCTVLYVAAIRWCQVRNAANDDETLQEAA